MHHRPAAGEGGGRVNQVEDHPGAGRDLRLVRDHAVDAETAKALWSRSEELVGERY